MDLATKERYNKLSFAGKMTFQILALLMLVWWSALFSFVTIGTIYLASAFALWDWGLFWPDHKEVIMAIVRFVLVGISMAFLYLFTFEKDFSDDCQNDTMELYLHIKDKLNKVKDEINFKTGNDTF